MALFDPHSIPTVFLTHASEILGSGLSGSEIVRHFSAYAIDFNVDIPHAQVPLAAPNKRTALRENLAAFSPQQQYKIIKELCELDQFKINQQVKDLKIKLVSRYSQFSSDSSGIEINESLIEETTHWLENYPTSLKLYNEALTKFQNDVFTRNLLDDLRLALELLLQAIFNNEKSLENQIGFLGEHLKSKGGSKELTSMFLKLVEYYDEPWIAQRRRRAPDSWVGTQRRAIVASPSRRAVGAKNTPRDRRHLAHGSAKCLLRAAAPRTKYHNTYVKHDDSVIEEEIEFIFEITSSFMKHIIRFSQ